MLVGVSETQSVIYITQAMYGMVLRPCGLDGRRTQVDIGCGIG